VCKAQRQDISSKSRGLALSLDLELRPHINAHDVSTDACLVVMVWDRCCLQGFASIRVNFLSQAAGLVFAFSLSQLPNLLQIFELNADSHSSIFAAYATYVWANKTDEYNSSKAGHQAHSSH
jgi:hypothetical protein